MFLLPVGLIRLFTSTTLYLTNPLHFRSKTWYLHEPKWKNLPLYFLLLSLPISSLSEIFLFVTFPSSSTSPTYHFSFLHHSLLLFLFWVFAILPLLRDCLDPALVNDGFLFVFAGVLFLIKYWFTGEGISGILGGAVYGLAGNLALLCGFCCFCLAIRPTAFFAEFCLSCGLVFKGLWFLQSGLCLYTDVFAPKGCKKVMALAGGTGRVEMRCDLDEDGLRAVALLNLLFVGYAIGVLILGLCVFRVLARKRLLRRGEATGPLLARIEPEGGLMRGGPVFEME